MTYDDKMHIQNVDSFSHLLDRLCVENIKLADFNRRLEIESNKDIADQDGDLMGRLYHGLRLANEARAAIKNRLDIFLTKILAAGEYHVLAEQRTFRLPKDVNKEEIIPREDPGREFQDAPEEASSMHNDTHNETQ